MADEIEVGGAGEMKKVSPQQTKLRKAFRDQFPDEALKKLLFDGEQSRLLAEMKDFKETEGIQNLKTSLNFQQSKKGRRDIVEVFDGYLTQGLPSKEQYLKDMSKIKKNYKDIAQRPDDFINIEQFFIGDKREEIPEAVPKKPAKPPSMSPEEEIEMEKILKDKRREEEMRKGKTKKEEGREETKDEEREEERTETSEETKEAEAENVEMRTEKPKKEKMRSRRTEMIEPEVLPTKMDSIPPSRLSSSFKDVDELNDDIKYFLKNFKSLLKTEAGFYKKVDKKNKNQLINLHGRIVGKLSPKIPSKEKGKKVGVVIDAQEYIKNEMKRLMENNAFSNMRPEDVVIDVGDGVDKDDPNAKDIGDFEVKRAPGGGLAARREAIYRYAPTEADEDVGMKGRKSRKPKRLANIPLKPINERYTAERMVSRNPFARNVRTVKLKYLY